MRFDVLTLFPELFEAHQRMGVTRRAYETGRIELRLWALRDFGEGRHQRVDDRPFGGGPGMVMQAPVLSRAVAAVRAQRQAGREAAPLILASPAGRRLDQALVRQLAAGPGAIVLCGRYEGIDQRFIDCEVDLELSLGDFVLSGGEIAALALLDAVARLQVDVLGNEVSHQQDSFDAGAGLLDCPHYTQPPVWEGMGVPPVLMSGHHADIRRWRREQALALTWRRRPDLIEAARSRGDLDAADLVFLERMTPGHL
jgi:tRNA (guanine37-N1)-methyltransferase